MDTMRVPRSAQLWRRAIRCWPTDAGIGRLIGLAPPVTWEDGDVTISLMMRPLQLVVDPRTYSGKAIYYRGSYEEASLTLLRRLVHPGMMFVDVGANVGLYTVVAGHLVGSSGHVIAVEPQRALLDRLHENCRLNGLENRVAVFAVALAAAAGDGTLHHVSTSNDGQATLRVAVDERCFHDPIQVELRTLDSILCELQVDRVDGMKIDVEGAELEVLQGYDRGNEAFPEFVFVECIDKHLRRFGHSAEELIRFLCERDYVLACRYRGLWRQFRTADEHRRFAL